MPLGPDNDPVFEKIGRWGDLDVARWGEEGGDYSDDRRYRWSFRRRWGPGGSVCWVGLNPGTGDSDDKPRPTLRKMVAWSERLGAARSSLSTCSLSGRRSRPTSMPRPGTGSTSLATATTR